MYIHKCIHTYIHQIDGYIRTCVEHMKFAKNFIRRLGLVGLQHKHLRSSSVCSYLCNEFFISTRISRAILLIFRPWVVEAFLME
jgi:hypothetical protein